MGFSPEFRGFSPQAAVFPQAERPRPRRWSQQGSASCGKALLLTGGSGEFWPAKQEQQAARKAAQDSPLTARHGLVGLGLLL